MNTLFLFYCHRRLFAAIMIIMICCATAQAQRSLGTDDIFVFDNLFSKANVGKKFNATPEYVWDLWVHDFHFYEGAGYSAIAELANGSWGNVVGLGYALNFLNPNNAPINLALFLGAEFGIYNARYKNVNKSFSQVIDDSPIPVNEEMLTGSLFYNVILDNANEKSSVYYLNIPVMLRYTFATSIFGSATGRGGYQFGSPDVHSFYISAGAKVGIPLMSSFSSDYRKATVNMYDSRTHQIHEDQELYGLKDFSNEKMSGELNPQLSVMFSFEFGYILPLQKLVFSQPWHERVNFYGGLFVDYALSRIAPVKESPLLWNAANPAAPIPGSILETSPLRNMIIGLKVGVWYSVGQLQ